jgi:hypothetical protein
MDENKQIPSSEDEQPEEESMNLDNPQETEPVQDETGEGTVESSWVEEESQENKPEETSAEEEGESAEIQESGEEPSKDEEAAQPTLEEEELQIPEEVGHPPVEPREESRMSKFFRSLLKWTIFGIVLFALGAVLTFVMAVQPARQELSTTQGELLSVQEKLTQSEATLKDVSSRLTETEGTLQQTQEELLLANSRNQFLRVVSEIHSARYLLGKKEGASARLALLKARTELDKLLEFVNEKDAELALLLDVRLERAINNLAGDPEISEIDLDALIQDMNQLEKILFPGD